MLSLLLTVAALPQGTVYRGPRWTPEVQVVRDVAPAVVYIESKRTVMVRTLFNRKVPRQSVITGSGVVIEDAGYIVTNYHVVASDPETITVQFDPDQDTKVYDAELVSYVAADDLALLRIHGDAPFPTVRRGTSSDLMLGERVIAIGNPLEQKLTVSAGIISGLHRNLSVETGGVPIEFSDLIQTDAAINQGNSGGPLLNILGELIGINSAVTPGAENMGFAIPVDRVEEVLREHLLAPSASRAWLGFEVDEADSFCVLDVIAGGPAAQAGLEPGDRLLGIDGQTIHTADDYRLMRLPLVPNQPVRLRVETAGGQREIVLRGWDKVDGALFERTGMTVEPFAVGRQRWVRVSRVAPDGPAAELGLAEGDVVDAVRVGETGQAWRIHAAEAFASLVAGLEPGQELWIDVLRDDDGDRRLGPDELYKGVLRLR